MNHLDATLQSVCPCVMCPRHEPLTLLGTDTHRFIAAEDGLHLEVRRPWVHAVLRIADSAVPMPYGKPPALFSLGFRRNVLRESLKQFIAHARTVAPLEHACWLTYGPEEQGLGYFEPEILTRGSAHIRYRRPEASPECLPVIDCHSHGLLPAFFSATDDQDDQADDAKLAFVVGNLDRPVPSVAMRFAGLGLSLDISDFARNLLYPGLMQPATEPETHVR